jgi:enamine deaminase RidA (YjgF/YER057c/UK114 family)
MADWNWTNITTTTTTTTDVIHTIQAWRELMQNEFEEKKPKPSKQTFRVGSLAE